MGKEHHLIERRQEIVEAVGKADKLSVLQLSKRFNVSEVTIRNDLQALNDQGFLLRTRGGAVSTKKMHEFSFDVRQQKKRRPKSTHCKSPPLPWSITATPSSWMPAPPGMP